jgi:hypothetical protein
MGALTISRPSDIDPVFVEVSKALYGDAVDPRELWDLVKSMPGSSDLHVNGAGAQKSNKKRNLAGGLLLGTAAESLGTRAAFKEAFPSRAGKVGGKLTPLASKLPKLPKIPGGKKAEFGLQAVNLGVGLAAAHELLKKPKQPKPLRPQPVAKGLLRPVKTVNRTLNNAHAASASAASAAKKVDRLIPNRKTAAVLGGGALVAVPAANFVATYQGAKRGARAAQRPVVKSVTWAGQISKVDTDRRQVFGWCSLSEINGERHIDLQGDYVPIDEIEKSAYRYVIQSRKGGDMHRRVKKGLTTNFGDEPLHTADLVESFVVTPEKLSKMGLPENALPLGWWVGFQVNDDEQWQLVKEGKRTGFSIHGTGVRKDLE